MDRIDDIMGKWNRHREIEVFLTTFDGAQHLRLHGWLKRSKILIKTENVFGDKHTSSKDFGMFIIVVLFYIISHQICICHNLVCAVSGNS